MQLTWLGTAGFKIDTHEGATLLIDPYLSRPQQASPPSPVQLVDLFPVDEILLTNGRFDHSLDIPTLVEQTGAIVHAPLPVCQSLARKGVSKHSLECVTPKKKKTLGNLSWQALPSLASQVDSSPVLRALTHSPQILSEISILDQEWPLGEIVAYFLEAEGVAIIHFGSAGWLDSEIDHLQPDIALLPVERAPDPTAAVVQLVARLKPSLVIPHHWDNYYPPLSQPVDLGQFQAVMKTVAPAVKIYIPTLGQNFNPVDLLNQPRVSRID